MTNSILLLLACWVAAVPVIAQTTTVNVVSRTIEKTFNYKNGYEVNIEGEKADINIRTWDKKEIAVTITLMAKHPDKAVAERDIEALQYAAQRQKNNIYLRNFVHLSEGAKPVEAQLSATYTITLPQECPVYLKNHFGEAQVSNLNGRLKINGQFSKIGMENIQGTIEVQSRFGDIIGRKLNGDISMRTRRSDITLYDLKGRCNIEAAHGILNLFASRDLLDLTIRGEQTDVFFHHPDPQWFGYSLTAQHGKVVLPEKMRFSFLENLPDNKKVQFKPNREYYANVTISVNFGSIVVRKK